jgi:hypothetical protein
MANGATYVSPRPAIKLKGAPNDDMVTSLLDIAVRAPEAGMASAEIRMVNWGTQPSAPVNFLFNTVAIGDKIEIAFGLAQQKTVFSGEVTAIEERYGDGVPQIVLLAEDALHRLARHRVSREALPAPVTLDAGDTLKRLRVIADVTRQPLQAAVSGQDLTAGAPITATGTTLMVPASGPTAASLLRGLGWDGAEIFVDPAPATPAEATDYANAAFDGQGRRFLHGDLVCGGNPDVMVGAAVSLTGVSPRLTGVYAVVACAHLFDESAGYQTYARIERADSG